MKAYVVENEALNYNIETLLERANGVPIWAVLKGNGYGIGAVPLARRLREHGIDRFCVTELCEAQLLRENGFDSAAILMLRQTSCEEELKQLLDLRVILTVGSSQSAAAANKVAAARAQKAQVHLKIDTGMGRFGFLPTQVADLLAVYKLENLAICGVYTHFNCAFFNEKLTQEEFALFMQTVEAIRAAGMDAGTVHCCNSAAFLRHQGMHCDGVRIGSAILGRMPFTTTLKPIGYAEACIDEIRELPKGHSTGYAALWKAKTPTRVAIVPIGWHNGFRVQYQLGTPRFRDALRMIYGGVCGVFRRSTAQIDVGGHRCPLIGQAGMLHIAVNVTGIDCKPGDIARIAINPLHLKGMEIAYR
ncbi:MAG: alanine racemase [Oscillospiraceae bacterium]|jgi:alanine racemase|nr:alanine racemase [Oscillospiraceae bacterium]